MRYTGKNKRDMEFCNALEKEQQQGRKAKAKKQKKKGAKAKTKQKSAYRKAVRTRKVRSCAFGFRRAGRRDASFFEFQYQYHKKKQKKNIERERESRVPKQEFGSVSPSLIKHQTPTARREDFK